MKKAKKKGPTEAEKWAMPLDQLAQELEREMEEKDWMSKEDNPESQ